MANEKEGESLRVDCDGGKYTYIMMKGGAAHALRYGQPWIANMYKIEGCNMTLALASDLDEARKHIGLLGQALGKLLIAIGMVRKDIQGMTGPGLLLAAEDATKAAEQIIQPRKDWDGIPDQPHENGWHWLRRPGGTQLQPFAWSVAEGGGWETDDLVEPDPETMARQFDYFGPIMMPKTV